MSDYFHTDDPSFIAWFKNVIQQAQVNERSIRLKTNSRNELFIKVGEGAWTAPFASTPDPYRDGWKPL